jgi:fructokinase
VIIVGGEALVDLLVHADGRLASVPGGGPYNTARTIGRLGLGVAFVGALSVDRFGRELRDGLASAGVVDSLVSSTDAPTTLAVAELDGTGVATYRFYVDGTSATAIAPGLLPDLGTTSVTAVHVGTLGLVLEPLAAAMEALIARAPDDALVMLDPNCRPSATTDVPAYLGRVDRLLARADVVKVSRDDLAFLRPDLDAMAAVADLLRRGAGAILLTDGGRPVLVVTPRGQASVEAPAVGVVDTVGAGDAFGGGFLAAWVGSGRSRAEIESDDALLEATRHAVRVAAFTCTRAGAEPPTAAELAAWTIATAPDAATTTDLA